MKLSPQKTSVKKKTVQDAEKKVGMYKFISHYMDFHKTGLIFHHETSYSLEILFFQAQRTAMMARWSRQQATVAGRNVQVTATEVSTINHRRFRFTRKDR